MAGTESEDIFVGFVGLDLRSSGCSPNDCHREGVLDDVKPFLSSEPERRSQDSAGSFKSVRLGSEIERADVRPGRQKS